MMNAFSVDLEDWYQGIEMPFDSWSSYEKRVEIGLDKVLKILSDNNTKGTFFTLGWIAEKYPHIIKNLAQEGHELASHGYSHEKVYNLSKAEFREEIRRTKSTIEDLAGQQVVAYRAPFFSITTKSLWALEILKEEGHHIDCSISSVKTWRYGITTCPDEIFKIEDIDIIEFPVSTFNFLGKKLALGGAYFRLFPFFISNHFYKKRQKGQAASMFYIHPWEYDPQHPVEKKMEKKARFTHYVNLKKTAPNTSTLVNNFQFDTVSNIVNQYLETNTCRSLKMNELHD